MRSLRLTTLLSLLLLSSCAKNEVPPGSNGPHASVLMRDGVKVTGTVLASSPTEIRLAGDDNITRTIPMNQVKTVDYGETPAALVATPAPPEPNVPEVPAARLPREQPAAPKQAARRVEPEPVHQIHERPTESVITTKTHELPVGTDVSVRVEETIDSAKGVEGQTYTADVTKDVLDSNGAVVIPRGSNAQLVIKSASKGGRFHGASDLVLDMKSVAVEGRQYQVGTVDVEERGKSGVGANKRTAEYTGGGAALGAIIGAIAGGGKGAAIGAGAGAGAGALTQILTKGGSIRVPVETVLTFRLDKPLRVVAAK